MPTPRRTSTSTIRSWLDRWIFDSYTVTAEGLGLYRITYALFALLFIAPGHSANASFAWLATIPDVFFQPPPGPMQLVSGFPPVLFFELLHGLLVLSLTAVLFGYYTRTASVFTTLLFLIGYGFSFSLGKINHNILFVLLPAGMALSNWGAAYSLDAQEKRPFPTTKSWPIVLVMLVTGFAMFTAGLPKILGGWLDPSTQAAQSRLIHQFFGKERQALLAPFATTIESPFLWEVFDVATVCFEIGFLIAIFSPITTRLFAVLAIGFHTGVMLVLNIAFLGNLIVYAAVLPWTTLACAFARHSAFSIRIRSVWEQRGLLLLTAGTFYVVGSPLRYLDAVFVFASDLPFSSVIAMGLAWGAIGISGFLTLRSSSPRQTNSRRRILRMRLPIRKGKKKTRPRAENNALNK